ncbi:CU044_5270 family protein [Streptosporangium sp. KLBMP 9127]|nr:CU044_5270 family protein [Streptosporangium sp. KLBMP 9127]
MDDLTPVRDLLASPPPSEEVVAAGRARLRTAMGTDGTEQVRRGRSAARWTALATGLLGVAAAVTIVIMPGTGADSPGRAPISQTPLTQPSARQILLAAAESAAKAPADGAYWVIKDSTGTVFLEPGGRYVLQQSASQEMWMAPTSGKQGWRIVQNLGAKPATAEDEKAWREDGSKDRWTFSGPHPEFVPGESFITETGERTAHRLQGKWLGSAGHLGKNPISVKELRQIPADPTGLRAYLESRITSMYGDMPAVDLDDPKEMEYRIHGSLMEIVVFLPVSPEVRAAAYKIMASLPMMEAAGEVTDPLGRTGQAILYRHTEGGKEIVNRMIVDTKTGLTLARETITQGRTEGGRAVELKSFTAYEEIGWTDEEPDLPS